MSNNLIIFNEVRTLMSKFFSEKIISSILSGITVGTLINDKKFQSKPMDEINHLIQRIIKDLKIMPNRTEAQLFSELITDSKIGLYKTLNSLEKTCLLIDSLINNLDDSFILNRIGIFFEEYHDKIINNLIKNKKNIPKGQQILINMIENTHSSKEYNFNLYMLLKHQYSHNMMDKLKAFNKITWRLFRIFIDDKNIYSQLKQIQSFDIKRNFCYFLDSSRTLSS